MTSKNIKQVGNMKPVAENSGNGNKKREKKNSTKNKGIYVSPEDL